MLDRIISSRARIGLLKTLLLHKDDQFYLRELVTLTGLPQGSVQRELANLVEAGVLSREQSGRQVYYRANHQSPVFNELRSILVKTVGVVEVLREGLAPIADRIRVAFIYGSIATGKETADSDIDVMIIGEPGLAEVTQALHSAEQELRREVSPYVFPPEEFRERVSSKEHFITAVMKETKLFLIGDGDELERAAGSGAA